MKLSSILYSFNSLKNNVYPFFAIVERKEDESKVNSFLSFSPQSVINKKQDIILKPGDKIRFFSDEEIVNLIDNFASDNQNLKPNILSIIDNKIIKSGSLDELVKGLIVRTEGAVVNPGKLLLADTYDLKTVLDISGGTNNLADLSNVEILFPYLLNDRSIGFENKTVNLLTSEFKKTF